MDLENRTPFPALLTRFVAGNDVMGSSLVVRVTYELAGETLVPAQEQTWKVSPGPWVCEHGPMEADDAFHKGGTDLFLFGSARAAQRKAVPRVDIDIEVGARFRRRIAVFGERIWHLRDRTLAPSPPRPFVELPLDAAHAYGGTAEWDGLQVPLADNPAGKGFFLEQEQALGRSLPNIEDPATLIQRWDDRPAPVGVGICPFSHSGRLKAGTGFGEDGVLEAIRPRLFNAAFPEMVIPEVHPGARVRVSGVHHAGALQFALPSVPVIFRLSLGEQVASRQPTIDQVGLEPDHGRVFLTYRYPFRYVLYARQQRRAELWPIAGV